MSLGGRKRPGRLVDSPAGRTGLHCSLLHLIIIIIIIIIIVFLALQPIVVVFSQPGSVLLASSFSRFLDHTQRRATVGRTPLDE